MRLKKCILNTKAIVKDLIAENSGNNNFMEGRKSDHKHFILLNPMNALDLIFYLVLAESNKISIYPFMI